MEDTYYQPIMSSYRYRGPAFPMNSSLTGIPKGKFSRSTMHLALDLVTSSSDPGPSNHVDDQILHERMSRKHTY